MNTTVINKIDEACSRYKKVQETKYTKFHKLDDWLYKESIIFEKEVNEQKKTYKKLKRGQIIKVDFGINIGSELCYTHFAIVLSNNDSIYSDNIIVIPITSKKGKNRIALGRILNKIYPNSSKYNLICYANVSQIKTISKTRIFQDNKKYICSNDILNKIDDAVLKEITNMNN